MPFLFAYKTRSEHVVYGNVAFKHDVSLRKKITVWGSHSLNLSNDKS